MSGIPDGVNRININLDGCCCGCLLLIPFLAGGVFACLILAAMGG